MYLSVPGYVYKLTNKNTGEFYFGSRVANIGIKRSPEKDLWKYYFSSSKEIKAIINAHGAEIFHPEIIYTNTDRDEVYWQEQKFIKEHIKNSQCLNQHYKDRESGQKSWSTHGVEPWNKNLSSPLKGIPRSVETLELMTRNRKGKNIGQIPWNKGKKGMYSEETIQKMSAAATGKTGEKNSFYGKTHSEETLKILRETQKRKVECPYCSKIGAISIMKRWHFDRCKHKK
jgi:hypothetical protein